MLLVHLTWWGTEDLATGGGTKSPDNTKETKMFLSRLWMRICSRCHMCLTGVLLLLDLNIN